ncbi:hypothetical protein RMATCC62417_00575 [Rhizopus microsporus]|nr:hypothetical protein RMATCC62417_00575 [Rhizopus microsporus]
MEDVHDSPIDDKAFNTSHDHLVLFRLPAIIRQVKDEFKTDTAGLRGKLRVVELLEKTTIPFIPFYACVGS